MTGTDYAVKGFQTRPQELSELDALVGTGANRADLILRGIARAIADGCTTAREALEVALMVAVELTEASEAVQLVTGDAHDQRTKDASRRAELLIARMERVSADEGTAEQRTYDMHDAEADRERADFDDEPVEVDA